VAFIYYKNINKIPEKHLTKLIDGDVIVGKFLEENNSQFTILGHVYIRTNDKQLLSSNKDRSKPHLILLNVESIVSGHSPNAPSIEEDLGDVVETAAEKGIEEEKAPKKVAATKKNENK